MAGISNKPIEQEFFNDKLGQGKIRYIDSSLNGITLFRFDGMEDWQTKIVETFHNLGLNTYLKRHGVWVWENAMKVAGEMGNQALRMVVSLPENH